MTSTEVRAALGPSSRRLLASVIRKFVYESKARTEPEKFESMLLTEAHIYEAAHKDWLDVVKQHGDMNNVCWRADVIGVLLNEQAEGLKIAQLMLRELEIPCTPEIARFIELSDVALLYPPRVGS